MRQLFYVIWAAAVCAATTAWACACCTDPGQRLEQIVTLDQGILDEVQRIRFAPSARLLADPGFPDSVKGVSRPSGGAYRVRLQLSGRALRFDVVDPEGRAGAITLALPRRMTRFEVDPRLEAPSSNHGPTLYKEWQIAGAANLSGIFEAGRGQPQARLVLHGQGNTCTTADDFAHWTLKVTGAGAAFSFLGDIVRDGSVR